MRVLALQHDILAQQCSLSKAGTIDVKTSSPGHRRRAVKAKWWWEASCWALNVARLLHAPAELRLHTGFHCVAA